MNYLTNILNTASQAINYSNFSKSINRCSEGTSLALKMLGVLTVFSLLRTASAGIPDYCNKPVKAIQTCPLFIDTKFRTSNSTSYYGLELPKNHPFYEADKIYKLPQVQKILLEDICPSDSPGYSPPNPFDVLIELKSNENFASFFFDKNLHQQINQFNELISFQPKSITKAGFLITLHQGKDIDLTKLLSKNTSPESSMQIKLFNSVKGIRIAQPNDKDIALVVLSSPKMDHNGAFSFDTSFKTVLPGLRKISEKYPLHFIEAITTEELIDFSKKAKNNFGNIKIMMIMGHGTENSITLGDGDKSEINPNFINELFFSRKKFPIDRDGTIILHSCSGGKGKTQSYSLAQVKESLHPGLTKSANLVNRIAGLHPGVEVVGLIRDAGTKLKVDDLEKRKFSLLTDDEEVVSYRVKASRKPVFFGLINSDDVYLEEV